MTHRGTFVSLFAGIGGFDLGLEAAGYTCVGQCEIDPHARDILTRHWPNVPKHDDVTTLQHDTFAHPELVTFGSPCQDLSVAGKRAGLADGDTRSGLFYEAVRYIRDILEATDGLLPRFALWENVPGAYSSNGGRDFATVLSLLVGGDVRVPTTGWSNAGVAFGPLGSAEWRTLDSQYFGVPQRRRRIFLVYRPGGTSAGEVLLEPDGVRGNPPQGREAGEGVTGPLEARTTAGGWPGTDGAVPETSGDQVNALRGSEGGSSRDYIAFAQNQRDEVRDLEGRAGALAAEPGRPMSTLAANSDPHVTIPIDLRNAARTGGAGAGTPSVGIGEDGDPAFTVTGAANARPAVGTHYAVRRLTPRECERLQGFPDDWTAGKADTHRYRMLGNAVTTNVIHWIARRLP